MWEHSGHNLKSNYQQVQFEIRLEKKPDSAKLIKLNCFLVFFWKGFLLTVNVLYNVHTRPCVMRLEHNGNIYIAPRNTETVSLKI